MKHVTRLAKKHMRIDLYNYTELEEVVYHQNL